MQQSTCGTRKGYRDMGCRCGDCRKWNRDSQRKYVAAVVARDGVTPTQKYRPGATMRGRGECSGCGSLISGVTTESPLCRECRYARNRGSYIHPAVRALVYERDKWVCQICREPIDPALGASDRMSATLDHIECQSWALIPDHSPKNLRMAHRSCNSRRGNRGD